jgi:WD40 repeat protein
LQVFNTEDGKVLQTLALGFRPSYGERTQAVLSKDGRLTYAWRKVDEIIQLVELNTETSKLRVIVDDKRKQIFSSLILSHNNKLLAYQRDDNPWQANFVWQIVDVETGKLLHTVDSRPVRTTAAFSPDDQSFWLVSEGGIARYDLRTSKFNERSADPMVSPSVLTFSDDGKRIYGVAGAETICWDVATGKEIGERSRFEEFYARNAHIFCVYLSPNAERSIWTRCDHQVRSLKNGKQIAGFYSANSFRGKEYQLSPNHRRIVHDAYYGELILGDLWTGETKQLRPRMQPRESCIIAIAPDNNTMALIQGSYDSRRRGKVVKVEIWDLDQGKKTRTMSHQVTGGLTMKFAQDSRELFVGDRAWDIKTGNSLPISHWGMEQRMTPNRHWSLKTAFDKKTGPELQLIDNHSGKVARIWTGVDQRILAVAFSNDMQTFAVSTNEQNVVLCKFYGVHAEFGHLKKLSPNRLIGQLSHEDSRRAFNALSALVEQGDEAVKAIGEYLLIEDSQLGEIKKTIAELASRDFKTRDQATKKLRDPTEGIVAVLLAALKNSTSAEQRRRLSELIRYHSANPRSRDDLSTFRCVEALEAIQTAKSKSLLEKLANANPDLRKSREARAVLARLSEMGSKK